MSAPDPLADDIDAFVDDLLDGYSPRIPLHSKVINDPIWGTKRLHPHEVALLDSPVLQRLRWIHQTGLSFFTFPSTQHTRFEHSLGAVSVATRMIEALAERHDRIGLDPFTGLLAEVRAAALLHDCGHAFASHASEELYGWLPELRDAKLRPTFASASPSEILSWYIIRSPAFHKLLEDINSQCKTTLDADRLADLVVGAGAGDDAFVGEIIKGPFDVDRIDYILRDAYYSGIGAAIDLERFFHDVDIDYLADGKSHLILRSTHAIEQLLFTKVHLFARFYRHQKVLASDAMLHSLVWLVRSKGLEFHGVTFSHPSDFLRLTDMDILGGQSTDGELATMLRNLRERRELPQRCVVVSNETIRAASMPGGARQVILELIRQVNEVPGGREELRDAIWAAVSGDEKPAPYTIVPTFPGVTPLREASQVYVKLRGSFPSRGHRRGYLELVLEPVGSRCLG